MQQQEQSVLASRAQASQDFVPVEEVRDGVLVMKDGSLRAVLMTSSINFALKSTAEQDAIIMQFQNFLNSLDFSVQFSIQSRGLDIEPYLDTLRERKRAETNELLQIQITEYIAFIKEFVASTDIVTKSFYIVVIYSPAASLDIQRGGLKSIFSIFGGSGKGKDKTMGPEKFEENKTQLWQRVNTVIDGLIRTGVRAAPLNTQELVELLYTLYNPGERVSSGAPKLEAQQ